METILGVPGFSTLPRSESARDIAGARQGLPGEREDLSRVERRLGKQRFFLMMCTHIRACLNDVHHLMVHHFNGAPFDGAPFHCASMIHLMV